MFKNVFRFSCFFGQKKSLNRQKPTIVPQHVICLGPDQKKIMIRNNDVFRLFMCFHSKNYCFGSNLCFKILLTIIDIYKSKKTDVL